MIYQYETKVFSAQCGVKMITWHTQFCSLVVLGKKKNTSKAYAIQSFNWNIEFFLYKFSLSVS